MTQFQHEKKDDTIIDSVLVPPLRRALKSPPPKKAVVSLLCFKVSYAGSRGCNPDFVETLCDRKYEIIHGWDRQISGQQKRSVSRTLFFASEEKWRTKSLD